MYSRGVTDSEVARLTGVNQSTITRLRQGTQKKASADLYFRICAVYRSRFPEDTAGASHD
jgi:transcriptional regulator with XRE-family HTH domain